MTPRLISVFCLCLLTGACSFYAQPEVGPRTSLSPETQVSPKDPRLKNLAVQFEAVTPNGSRDMRLTYTQDQSFGSRHQSLLTDGNVITSKQLASLDVPSAVVQSNRPLFGKSGLAFRITTSDAPPVVRFLSSCPSLNFDTANINSRKSHVACGNDQYTYDWDIEGIKIKKNNQTVFEVMLAPGIYRLDGEIILVE